MADFLKAVSKTLTNEGGFADRRSTTGEVVNRGITLDTLWRLNLVPKFITRDDPASDEEVEFVESLSLDVTREIYEEHYWRPLACSRYTYQPLADKTFDLYVNTGRAKMIQQACNDIHWPGVERLVEDGIIGERSIAAINAADGALLLGHCGANGYDGVGLLGVAERYYRSLKDDGHNLDAWLARLLRP